MFIVFKYIFRFDKAEVYHTVKTGVSRKTLCGCKFANSPVKKIAETGKLCRRCERALRKIQVNYMRGGK